MAITNELWILTSFILMRIYIRECAPLSQEKLPSKEMENFMKRFGYIETKPGSTEVADALYTEEGFKKVVQEMQLFGGLPQTGELDEATLNLTKLPRCGVPDVLKARRTRRYIIGAEAWKKKKITYFLANWPPELEPELVRTKLAKALGLWSGVTPLRFVPRENMDADIIVAFGNGPHGDGYPFDGPGGILAHAYFPYEHDSYGGDIHFDDAETWIDGSTTKNAHTDVVDFYTVAAHEIGHSLGLAHSTVPGSIMFPYYKGYNDYMRLDYDDIVAMYTMYVLNANFEDTAGKEDDIPSGEDDNIPTNDDDSDIGRDEPGPTDDDIPNDDDDLTDDYAVGGKGDAGDDYSTEVPDEDFRTEEYPETSSPEPEDRDESVEVSTERLSSVSSTTSAVQTTTSARGLKPDLCEGSIDAAELIRGELFVFKGLYTWRFRQQGEVIPGYPVLFHEFFRGLPWSARSIDAVYQRPQDYHILFFIGPQYWIFDGNHFTDNSPQPLTNLGLPNDLEKIDAAIVWAKNGKTYFFSEGIYWRYDEKKKSVEPGYPQRMARWRGLPNLDAAFTWTDGKTYFFKGNQFWRFNNKNISSDPGFPLPTAPYWFGCS